MTEQSSAKSIRWYSTVESAENLEFSVLAVLESICAVSLSLWLTWYFRSYTHVIVAIVLAPLLLLRTEESTRLGLKWFGNSLVWFGKIFSQDGKQKNNFTKILYLSVIGFIIFATILWSLFAVSFWIWLSFTLIFLSSWRWLLDLKYNALRERKSKFLGVIILVVVVLGAIAVGLCVITASSLIIKFIATTFTFFRHPLTSLQAIPKNWYRIVLATDTAHPPELLPGMESRQYNHLIEAFEGIRFRPWLENNVNNQNNAILKIFSGILTLIIFLPALLYRWSLKSSALFYLPFLWIIGTPAHRQRLQENLDEQIELWKDTKFNQAGVVYAWIVLIFFTALPLFLRIHLTDLLAISPATGHHLIETIVPFFVAFEWEAWHVAQLFGAVITVGVWFYVDILAIQRKRRKEAGLQGEAEIIFHLLRFRLLLSLFTLACGGYVLYQLIPWTEIFRDFQWFP